MLLLIPRLLQYPAGVRDDHRVGCDDEGRVGDRGEGVVDGDGVDIEAFLDGGLQDVFEGWEGLGEVLGFSGGEDFEVVEADLLILQSMFSRFII